MITMEDWITIKNLKKRCSDLGTRKIAKILGVSRNTVKRALSLASGPEYQKAEKDNPDIEPFKDIIYEMFMLKKFCGSRILDEIKSKGFNGSKSAFYRHLATIKEPVVKYYTPYETAPGEQAQYDWSPYEVHINGSLTNVYVFIYILGFSRFRIYEGSLSETQSSIFEALESSFIKIGGVSQRIQTDNAKSFIINASKDNFQWNKKYLQFCGHYSVLPSRSLPGHPWSKGKVERPFDYLEEHFIRGSSFENFLHFLQCLEQFQYKVNTRVHDTTKKTPLELFEYEKPSLGNLPDTLFNMQEEFRKVTADCLISYNGNKYSVPWPFASSEVWIKVSKGYLLNIYSVKNKLIATHNLSTGKGQMIIKEEHYQGHKVERGNWTRLSQLFLKKFPNQQPFLDKLKVQKRININYALTKILDIIEFYDLDDVQKTLDACFTYDIFTYNFIQGYLENNFQNQIPIKPLPVNLTLDKNNISIKRNLNEYKL